MKYFITTIFCLVSYLSLTAQQLTLDTIKANDYLRQAKQLEDGFIEKIVLIEKAAALCTNYDIPKKIVTINSELTYQYARAENEKTMEIGQKNIDFAKAKLNDDKLPELGLTYWGMQRYLFDADFEASEVYGKIAFELLPKGSDGYFDVTCRLMQFYNHMEDEISLETILNDVKKTVKTEEKNTSKYAYFALYYGQFMYHDFYNNPELVIQYGRQLILEVEKNQLEYRTGTITEIIGISYGQIGQMKEAVKWIEKAKNINNDENLFGYYMNLGYLYMDNEIYDKATFYLQKAVEIIVQDEQKNPNEENKIYLKSLYADLSFSFLQLKNYQKSEVFILKAFQYETIGTNYITNISYAELLNETKQYDKGLQQIQTSLIDLTLDFDNPNVRTNPTKFSNFKNTHWTVFALKIKVELLLNKFKLTNNESFLALARQTAFIAIDISLQIQEDIVGYKDNRLYSNEEFGRILILLQDIEYEQYQLQPTKKQLNILFKIVERSKALTLLATLSPANFPKSILQKEKELINVVRTMEQKVYSLSENKDSLDFYQTILIEAVYKLEQFQAELIKKYPKQASASYQFSYVDISAIQQKLSEKSLWIEYTYDVTKTRLYIFLIKKNEAVLKTVPIDDNFFEKIEQLQQLLNNRLLIQKTKQKLFISTSNYLYQQLLLPFESMLQNIDYLYIVPEQTLFNIPFEVLLPNNDIKPYKDLDYLIKQHAIGYQYSATVFAHLHSKPTVKDNSLLAFAPVFSNGQSENPTRSLDVFTDSLYRSIDNHRFVPLPSSKTEIETIGSIINPSATILLENNATKNALISALTKQPYQYVHLATHGLVNIENYKLSALACFNDNNLHDLLFVNEIIIQDINVDLVVLSSCESGIGKIIETEGSIALNRSFIYAGAKNVISSLWKVSDKYTSELMINFYKNQSQTTTYMETLRLSKLKLLEKNESASPQYWAAFVLIGK
ncbi:MAG: CHAT domain-containing protein [Saprospiraceae bacterium]